MVDPKADKQTKPNTAVTARSSATKAAGTPVTVPSQDTIRERAYLLYEGRGREPGQAEHDWLRAEQEILNQDRAGTTSSPKPGPAAKRET
jgi:hypothetical protein